VQSLPPHEVRVWYRFTESIADSELETSSAILSDAERARAGRFVFDRDRRDFIVAHALVRRTLSQYDRRSPEAWRIDATGGQKPAIAGDNAGALTFNLSHTHGLVACAIARDTSVGVDVESIERVTGEHEIAQRFFSPIECRSLDACEPALYRRRFIELWTLKESYLKGIGTGLSHPLHTFSFIFDANGGVTFDAPPDVAAADWQFVLAAPSPRYRLALAVRHPSSHPAYRIVLQDADAVDGRALPIIASSRA